MGQEQVWQEYARLTGGEVVPASILDGVDLRAITPYGPWKVALDTITMYNPNVHTRTAMKVPFFNTTGFQFTLEEKNLGSGLKGMFGKKAVSTGSAEFDKKFSITGNDADKVAQVFSDPGIQGLVAAQPHITLEISNHATPEAFTGKLPSGVSMLVYYDLSRKIKESERLKLIFDLICNVLYRMHALGLVGEGAPEVEF